MTSRWQKLNYLVPEPQCRMDEDNQGEMQITTWRDVRAQPSDAIIDAVADQQVIDGEFATEQENKFNKDTVKAMGLTMKDFMNEIMGGRTANITNAQLKAKFKSHL